MTSQKFKEVYEIKELYVFSVHTRGEETNNDTFFREPGINIFISKAALRKGVTTFFETHNIPLERIQDFLNDRYYPWDDDSHLRIFEYPVNPTEIQYTIPEVDENQKKELEQKYSNVKYCNLSIRVEFSVSCLALSVYDVHFNRLMLGGKLSALSKEEQDIRNARVKILDDFQRTWKYKSADWRITFLHSDSRQGFYDIHRGDGYPFLFIDAIKALPRIPKTFSFSYGGHQFTLNVKGHHFQEK